jgi:DNA-binding response OmpR family regulator
MGHILIADDNAEIRHVITYTLMEEGHYISVMRDGESTLETLLAEPPDLLILDIMMPGLDGFEVLEEIESWGLGDKTRVLVLSAKSADEDRERAMALGAAGFMCKPFDPDELVTKVDELLALSPAELRTQREQGRNTQLLSQLESLLGDA